MKRELQSGVTLIELLVVVTVIGILAAIAYPSYTEQMAKGRRAEAKGMLYDLLQRQERFLSTSGSFTTDFTALGLPGGVVETEHGTHTMTMAAGATGDIATSVQMVATPITDDTRCGTLTLTSAHVKTASGTVPTNCW